MSKESGVPTYRGAGGIWSSYKPEEVASQQAFDADPLKVLKFHEIRRKSVLECEPNTAHVLLSTWQSQGVHLSIITQNIDGLHQRAGSVDVIELHGSLWKLRCFEHGTCEDLAETYSSYKCTQCGKWLRPDITWFGDSLNMDVIDSAYNLIRNCDLFVSIGTSGVVWPAAGMPQVARENGAYCIEINPEETELTSLYQQHIHKPATEALQNNFQV